MLTIDHVSELESKFMTGAELIIDGGYTKFLSISGFHGQRLVFWVVRNS